MSRIIGILNYKGGTGKTTTVVNLAAGLALRGTRVLCIDLDAQGSLATCLGVTPVCYLTQLLLGEAEPQDCIISARENLDIIASDTSLQQAEGALWRLSDRSDKSDDGQTAQRLLINKLGNINGYDYIMLDYSPSASLLSESGLFYIQELIVPVAMNYMALIGIRQVIQTLQKLDTTSGHSLPISLIVPTFYYNRLRKDREIVETLRRYFAAKVTEPIRANVKLSEAPSHQMSIYEYAPRSAGAIDYARLVERVVNNAQ